MRASAYSIFRSAVLGFAITAAFVSYQLLTDSQTALTRSSSIMLMFLVLCPPSILSILRQVEVGTQNFYTLWAVIGVLNALLYASIRAFVSKRPQRPN
jgi:hypothetical protein